MEAIIEAEKWLSKKITKDYFDKINEDEDTDENEDKKLLFDKYKNSNRGIILSSAIFIETIEKIDTNHVRLVCSS